MANLEGKQPLRLSVLLVECNLPADEGRGTVEKLIGNQDIIAVENSNNPLLFTRTGWQKLASRARAIVGEYHRKFPARPGLSKGELSSKLKLTASTEIIHKLHTDEILYEKAGIVRLPEHEVQVSTEQQKTIDDFLRILNENPYSPPGEVTLETDILNLLIEQQKVVKVTDGVVFSTSAYDEMVEKVLAYAKSQGKVTLAEVRDMFNTSRKYAKALLEYMDEKKLTRRVGDERVIR